MTIIGENEFDREVRRVFRRFIEMDSYVTMVDLDEFGLFSTRHRGKKPILCISGSIWRLFEHRDFVTRKDGEITVWHPSEVGRAYWRRLLESAGDPFRAQHQQRSHHTIIEAGTLQRVEVNDAESPLAWLHRRKGANGRLLINEKQFEAGERLRRDFTIARMNPRVTTDWSFALADKAARARPRDPAEISDLALAARERLAAAMAGVGKGLEDVLIDVCCHQLGLEEIERRFGWPQRSGKIVLQIALDQLAEFYEYGRSGARIL
jgi:DNA-directed RNA polymerase specialized sigma24 family protein